MRKKIVEAAVDDMGDAMDVPKVEALVDAIAGAIEEVDGAFLLRSKAIAEDATDRDGHHMGDT